MPATPRRDAGASLRKWLGVAERRLGLLFVQSGLLLCCLFGLCFTFLCVLLLRLESHPVFAQHWLVRDLFFRLAQDESRRFARSEGTRGLLSFGLLEAGIATFGRRLLGLGQSRVLKVLEDLLALCDFNGSLLFVHEGDRLKDFIEFRRTSAIAAPRLLLLHVGSGARRGRRGVPTARAP